MGLFLDFSICFIGLCAYPLASITLSRLWQVYIKSCNQLGSVSHSDTFFLFKIVLTINSSHLPFQVNFRKKSLIRIVLSLQINLGIIVIITILSFIFCEHGKPLHYLGLFDFSLFCSFQGWGFWFSSLTQDCGQGDGIGQVKKVNVLTTIKIS